MYPIFQAGRETAEAQQPTHNDAQQGNNTIRKLESEPTLNWINRKDMELKGVNQKSNTSELHGIPGKQIIAIEIKWSSRRHNMREVRQRLNVQKPY